MQDFIPLLLAITENSCVDSFILQKYILPELEITVSTIFPDTIQILEEISPEIHDEVAGQSRRIMIFLSTSSNNMKSAKFTWAICNKILYLTSITTERLNTVAIRSNSASIQHPPNRNLNRKSIRPLSAFTEGRPITGRHGSLSLSTRVVIPIVKTGVENFSQTEECRRECECEKLIQDTVHNIENIMKESEELENLIKLAKEEGKVNRVEAEDMWKRRCLEISKVISEKTIDEKNKFIEKFSKLQQEKDSDL